MGKRRALFATSFLGALAFVVFLLYKIVMHVRPSSSYLGQFLALAVAMLVPVVLALGGMALKPVRDFLEEWLRRDLDRAICRIYLFGSRGSGKTSLIKNMLTAEVLAPQSATDRFDFYRRTISYDLKGLIRFDVLVGDYKGETPAEVILDLSEEFAGPKGDRAINALFFIVDLVPRILDEAGRVVDDERTLDWLKIDSEKKISQRVADHTAYMTAPLLQIVFSATYSPALRSVALIITKLDLIERAFKAGYLDPPSNQESKEWVRSHFRQIEQDIQRACDANNIPDFSVHVVSTREDTGMRALLSGVWKLHLQTRGVQAT